MQNFIKIFVIHHQKPVLDFYLILDLLAVNQNLISLQILFIFYSDAISRTPIQIDNQVPVPPVRLYNHVMPYITGPDIIISKENQSPEEQLDPEETEPKRSSGVEPTLDPTKVLTALVANNNGQLPPHQL
jgi:hypothetical protein